MFGMTTPAHKTGRTVDEFAVDLIATKTGVGMAPPFYSETGSTKGDQDWPFWIVRNKTCNSLGALMPREAAEQLASAMNRAALSATRTTGDQS